MNFFCESSIKNARVREEIFSMKPKLFTMKVEPSVLVKWHYFAKSKQMHLSDVIKRLMNAEELPETVPVEKPPKRNYSNVDPKLLFELNAIGNNINQISRRINEGQKFDAVIELSSIEQQLERVLNAHQIH